MKNVLVVEDSAIIREIAARILRELSIEPKSAADAKEALDACQAAKPDAILLDWDLPSMGALDVLKGVADLAPENRPTIVLCATENDPQQFTLAKAAGAAHYLLKPFDRRSIEEKLSEIGVIESVVAQHPAKAAG